MAAAFAQAVDGLTLPLGLLHEFTTRNDFAEFYSSSFPVFALGTQVSESDLNQTANTANEQACTELGFQDVELKEMGYAAAVPQLWRLHWRAPLDVVQWYHEAFDKAGNTGTGNIVDPQWYPLGFLGITSPDWKRSGAVLVFYDALPGQSDSQDVTVKAYRVDPIKVGATLISLRQGDDDYDNVKRWSALN
jgi:hypothetical protein